MPPEKNEEEYILSKNIKKNNNFLDSLKNTHHPQFNGESTDAKLLLRHHFFLSVDWSSMVFICRTYWVEMKRKTTLRKILEH